MDVSQVFFAVGGATVGASLTAVIAFKLGQSRWQRLAHPFERAHLANPEELSATPQAFFDRWQAVMAELNDQTQKLSTLSFKDSIAPGQTLISLRLAHASERIRVQMARISNHEAFINDHAVEVQGLSQSLQEVAQRLSTSADLATILGEEASAASQEELERGGRLAQLASEHHEEFHRIVTELNEKVQGCQEQTDKLDDFVGFLDKFAHDDELANLLNEVKQHLMELTRIIGEQELVVTKNETMLGKVRKIARQCTLLSFNAAIESSRNGANGLAFSVVANEIRELAEATEIATNEMESLSALLRSGFESMIRQSKEVVGSLASIMLVADENVQRVHDFLAQSHEMRAFILAGQEQLATTSKAMLRISDETDAFADQTVRDASLTARLVAKADEMAAQLNELRQDIPAIFDKIQASDRLIQDIRAADAEMQATLNEAKFERRSARRNREDRGRSGGQRAA